MKVCNNMAAQPISDTYRCNSVVLAKYIVAYANEHHFGINMTKVQKLLYIAYGIYLAVKNSRLTDEHPQAWPYGPVFPATRNHLLRTPFSIYTFDNTECADAEVVSLIGLVFRTYGDWNAYSLSAWSHKTGSPWDRAVSSADFRWGSQIPDEYIRDYFRNLISVKDGQD